MRHDKRSFDKPARQWTWATFAIGTNAFQSVLVHKPIADAEKAERCRNEAGLVRREPREAANPCPAYAKAKEYQRHNATRGRRKRAEKAARRHQPLSIECHDW